MGISELFYSRMEKGLDFLIKSKKVLIPDSTAPVEADGEAKLNMIVWGDPQISSLSPLRSGRMYSACMDIGNSRSSFDALVMLGDITEYGTKCEYKFTQKLLEPIAHKFKNIFAITGNHDIRLRNYKKQVFLFPKGHKERAHGHGSKIFLFKNGQRLQIHYARRRQGGI